MQSPAPPDDLRALDAVFARRVQRRVDATEWVAHHWPAPAPANEATVPETTST